MFLILFFVLALPLAFSESDEVISESFQSNQIVVIKDDLKLTVETDHTHYLPDEPIHVNWILENIGSQPYTYTATNDCIDLVLMFSILGDDIDKKSDLYSDDVLLLLENDPLLKKLSYDDAGEIRKLIIEEDLGYRSMFFSSDDYDALEDVLRNKHGVTEMNRAEVLSFLAASVPILDIPLILEYPFVTGVLDLNSSRLCAEMLTPVVLQPGEIIQQEYSWSQKYYKDHSVKSASPGIYEAEVFFHDVSDVDKLLRDPLKANVSFTILKEDSTKPIIENKPPPNISFDVSDIDLVNGFGNPLSFIYENQITQITAKLKNTSDDLIPFVFQISSDDSEPVWITGELESNQILYPSLSWIPKSDGLHTVTISVGENGDSLFFSTELEVTVHDLISGEMRECSGDFTLLIQHRTNALICVNLVTAEKLVQRGWGTIIESQNESIIEPETETIIESQNEPIAEPESISTDRIDDISKTEPEFLFLFGKCSLMENIEGCWNPNSENYIHGDGNFEFSWPWDVAVDSKNNIYVADYGNHRIKKFDSNGNFLLKFGEPNTIAYPRHIVIDSQDKIFVSSIHPDSEKSFRSDGSLAGALKPDYAITVFDTHGNIITDYGNNGVLDHRFRDSSGIAINSTNYLYVVDRVLQSVNVFDPKGNLDHVFGRGVDTGLFSLPENISIDSRDDIYIYTKHGRILVFDSDRYHIDTMQSVQCTQLCSFDFDIDSNGNVYFIDTSNNQIQVLDSSGNKKFSFGEKCNEQFFVGKKVNCDGKFESVFGITVHDDKIYVTDASLHTVYVFQI